MQEKFLLPLSKSFFKKTIFTKLTCISYTINVKINNKTASSLIIKKLNQAQDIFIEHTLNI